MEHPVQVVRASKYIFLDPLLKLTIIYTSKITYLHLHSIYNYLHFLNINSNKYLNDSNILTY